MDVDPWSLTLSNTHYQRVHPEYQKWFKRWTRELLVIGSLAASTLALSLFLFPCDIACQNDPFHWIGFYVLLCYMALMGLLVFQYRRGLGRLKRDWREGRGIAQVTSTTSEG